MMKKTTLTAAVVLGLTLSASSFAASSLNGPTPSANNLAPETIAATGAVPLSDTGASGAWDINAQISYSLSATEFRAARFECSNASIDASKVVVSSSSAGTSVGVPNQAGGAVVVSLTQGATAGLATDTLKLHINAAGGVTLATPGAANCTYSLYTSPADAINANLTQRIYTTGSQPWLTFAPTLSVVAGTQNTQYTAYTATPAFSSFSRTSPGAHFSNTVGMMNSYTFSVLPNSYDQDGNAVTTIPAAAYMALTTQGLATGSSATLNTSSTCSAAATSTFTNTVNGFTAPLSAVAVGTPYYLCYTTVGGAAIPNGAWTANVVSGSASTNGLAAGMIQQDGTTWQATLAQNPNGYQSRIVMTNMSNTAASYSLSLIGPDGTAQVSTGTLPANRQTSIPTNWDVHALGVNNDPNSFRATANVFVTSGPNQVKAMYQIVNVTTGSISNSQMITVDPTNTALFIPVGYVPVF
ncbi:MAG: hypothetical protein JSS25_11680 [Proteobacteria bacterium]|nr:hypothetical protein [Pseudomonadota bacterium]